MLMDLRTSGNQPINIHKWIHLNEECMHIYVYPTRLSYAGIWQIQRKHLQNNKEWIPRICLTSFSYDNGSFMTSANKDNDSNNGGTKTHHWFAWLTLWSSSLSHRRTSEQARQNDWRRQAMITDDEHDLDRSRMCDDNSNDLHVFMSRIFQSCVNVVSLIIAAATLLSCVGFFSCVDVRTRDRLVKLHLVNVVVVVDVVYIFNVILWPSSSSSLLQ